MTYQLRINHNVSHNAIINITNLRLRTFIGFNPDEMEKQQDVVINIEIQYPANKAFADDDVEKALNYKTITKEVIRHVEEGRFLLLEKLVMDVLEICTQHPRTVYAKVTIDKPHALRFADSVSLSLEWKRDESVSKG
jgi:D-erythro-7,8-dihydroneopterin triphosphate epimerase